MLESGAGTGMVITEAAGKQIQQDRKPAHPAYHAAAPGTAANNTFVPLIAVPLILRLEGASLVFGWFMISPRT